MGQTIAFLGGWWCGFGALISGVMIGMVWWHARRHVARLSLIPGVIDEVIVSTHNMIGNTPRRRILRGSYSQQTRHGTRRPALPGLTGSAKPGPEGGAGRRWGRVTGDLGPVPNPPRLMGHRAPPHFDIAIASLRHARLLPLPPAHTRTHTTPRRITHTLTDTHTHTSRAAGGTQDLRVSRFEIVTSQCDASVRPARRPPPRAAVGGGTRLGQGRRSAAGPPEPAWRIGRAACRGRGVRRPVQRAPQCGGTAARRRGPPHGRAPPRTIDRPAARLAA